MLFLREHVLLINVHNEWKKTTTSTHAPDKDGDIDIDHLLACVELFFSYFFHSGKYSHTPLPIHLMEET